MASNSIPTWHAGVLFRSRLEARYAFFFDRLDVKWEYETQGFVTDGQAYLPDFILFAATGVIWAEVKPTWQGDEKGAERFMRFALQRPQPSRAALLVGMPAVRQVSTAGGILVIGGDGSDDPLKGHWEDDTQVWRPCPAGYHFDLAYPGRFGALFAEDGCEQKFGGLGEQKLEDAVSAARSARFVTSRIDPPSGSAA